MKGRLHDLGVEIPSSVVEKEELVQFLNKTESQRQQQQRTVLADGSPKTPGRGGATWQEDVQVPSSPASPSGTRSVAELKKRLKELGFKVPTSIFEKSELLELVREAERQAPRAGATAAVAAPMAPVVPSSNVKLRARLKELGVQAPEGNMGEQELLVLLKRAEQGKPVEKIEQTLLTGVTATATRGAHGVARIEMTGDAESSMPPWVQDQGLGVDKVVQGSLFKWIRGDCIGHGASGTVFKALNQTNGQIIAVKEVHMDLQRKVDLKFKESLENEIALMRDMRHPNVVEYYGCDWIGTSIFMYLEYMVGGSIARVLDQFGAFEESLVAEYARQLLNGLEYLHTQNPYVVHRDIKGANVLLGLDSVVKLADFGCSKREKETRSLSMEGSIPWMAPEVIAHARYGRAGDIWSFGCLLIEMASAAPPWGDFDNLMAAMIKIGMSSEMPSIPETYSPMYRAFVKRCLNRDPGRRLSATELLNERFVRLAAGGDFEPGNAAESMIFNVHSLPIIAEEQGTTQNLEPELNATTRTENIQDLLAHNLLDYTLKSEAANDDCGDGVEKAEDDEPLPQGWERHFDDSYGEWYFWHKPTGRASWERPTADGDDYEEEDDRAL